MAGAAPVRTGLPDAAPADVVARWTLTSPRPEGVGPPADRLPVASDGGAIPAVSPAALRGLAGALAESGAVAAEFAVTPPEFVGAVAEFDVARAGGVVVPAEFVVRLDFVTAPAEGDVVRSGLVAAPAGFDTVRSGFADVRPEFDVVRAAVSGVVVRWMASPARAGSAVALPEATSAEAPDAPAGPIPDFAEPAPLPADAVRAGPAAGAGLGDVEPPDVMCPDDEPSAAARPGDVALGVVGPGTVRPDEAPLEVVGPVAVPSGAPAGPEACGRAVGSVRRWTAGEAGALVNGAGRVAWGGAGVTRGPVGRVGVTRYGARCTGRGSTDAEVEVGGDGDVDAEAGASGSALATGRVREGSSRPATGAADVVRTFLTSPPGAPGRTAWDRVPVKDGFCQVLNRPLNPASATAARPPVAR
ncbi:hypothetical protein RM704_41490 [Streptomyces sp. DSM 3412]|uniref:Uncharacterized protein n=1 Tax=Streptomyces gottesmaniae TaxID=3075518 RepID=A0ABU2ZB79_9ACTN|nr:hypothetical protein [Streptomyces sp. DSM 3412]MDT0573849.1 hypothetical protein [Streptomyces sp. DSM 3412]